MIVIMEMEITRGNGEITIHFFFFFFTMLDLVKLFSFSGFLCTIFFLHDTQLQSFVVIHFIHSYAIFFARFIYICMHVLFALFAYFYKHISNQGNKF